MSSGIYHIEDPLENFKIRIRVREVYRPHHARENIDSALFEDDIVISWQEKLFGPRDVIDYIAHKGSTRGPPSQLDNRRHLGQIEKSGKDATSILNETMLYTYINDEPFFPDKSTLLDIDSGKETYLSYASETVSEQSGSDSRLTKVAKRLNRERQKTTMHICLGADIDKDRIKNRRIWSSGGDFSEFVLLTIQLTKSGVMVASPPFSHIVPESGGGQQMSTVGDLTSGSQPIAASVFLDDSTVIAGMQKGFQLGTYRVRTAKGSEFEYTIENVNGVLSPAEMEDLRSAEDREDRVLAEQSRGVHLADTQTENWQQKPPPDPYTLSCKMHAEIVSATGFGDGDSIYVKYQAALPKNWGIRKEDTSTDDVGRGAGTSPRPRGKNPSTSEKAKLLQGHGNSSFASAVDDQEMVLQGFTQLNTVGYGRNTSRSVLVHAEKGTEMKTSSVEIPTVPAQFMADNPFGRFLVGWIFLALTGLAILMGFERPLWIVPSLVFVFVLGIGTPGSSPQVVVYSEGLPRSQMDGDGMGVEVVGDVIAEPSANFGHVFSADLLVNEKPLQMKAAAPSAEKMTLFFEVYSVSSYRRHTLQGCGYTTVSPESGEFEVEISTWKPIGDLNSSLMDFFVGGGAHLSNVRFMEIPNKMATGLSKFGSRTESSGSIRFKYSIVCYNPSKAKIDAERKNNVPAADKPGRRTVEDIMKNYRNVDLLNKSMSRKSLQSLSPMASKTPRSSRSLFNGSEEGEDLPLNVDKVADIIARARASANGSVAAAADPKARNRSDRGPTSKSLGGIAMKSKRPQQGGYTQLENDAEMEDDFLPQSTTTSGLGGHNGSGEASLVDRLEQSGIVGSGRDAQRGKRGGALPKISSGTDHDDQSNIDSPMQSVSNTPARRRKDRYSDSEDNEGD